MTLISTIIPFLHHPLLSLIFHSFCYLVGDYETNLAAMEIDYQLEGNKEETHVIWLINPNIPPPQPSLILPQVLYFNTLIFFFPLHLSFTPQKSLTHFLQFFSLCCFISYFPATHFYPLEDEDYFFSLQLRSIPLVYIQPDDYDVLIQFTMQVDPKFHDKIPVMCQ